MQAALITSLLALFGVVILGLLSLASAFLRPETFGTLELVDVNLAPMVSYIEVGGSRIPELESDAFKIESNSVQLDIQVRNTGAEVAFLNRAELQIERIWNLSTSSFCCGRVLPSANYDVALPLMEEPPFSVSQSISQAVSPNSVDRFTITIGSNIVEDDTFIDAVVLMKLVIGFNGTNDVTADSAYLFSIENIDTQTGDPMWEEIWEELAESEDYFDQENLETIEEIQAVDAIRSERVEQILQSHGPE